MAGASTAWSAAPTLDGAWMGTLTLVRSRRIGAASASLTQAGGVVQGTVTLAADDVSGTVTIKGRVSHGTAHFSGRLGAHRLRWKGHWLRARGTWKGVLTVRATGGRTRARLALVRAGGDPRITCGAAYFASDVLPRVFQPICAQCHVANGLAQTARFRVTPGDPTATAVSALALVDFADPSRSLLIAKPRATAPHGGGVRLSQGSAEDGVLVHWVELVTAPGCGGNGGGTGDPYLDNCASCHGADARGLDGRPDIHCNRDIRDAVRNGRSGPAGIMPSFPGLTDVDIATIQAFLADLCPTTTVTGAELFASNCATCHGAEAVGTSAAPRVRCATRVADAVRRGRGPAMPAFTRLPDAELVLVEAYLAGVCDQHGRSGEDLYAGNCATCHGQTAGGGRNGLGVRGPDVQCTGAGDYQEKVRSGDDDMPAFPALGTDDVDAIVTFVHGAYCAGD
jgi:mono/diheme cytochrome c family protein